MSPQPYGVSSPAPDRGMGTNYGSALSAAALLSPAALSRHTPDSNVFKWVLGTIKKTEDKLVRSSQLFERMLAEDPEQMADEYMIRSQASDEQQKKLTSSSDFHDEDSRLVGESLIADGQGQGQEIDDQEDVLTAEEIKLERENIMQSTQAEKANLKADADIGCSNNDLKPVQPPLKATSTQGGSFAPGLSNNPNLSQHLRLDKRNPTLTLGSLFNPNRKRTNVSYTNSEANEPVLPSVPQSSNNPAVKESFSLLYDSPIGIASSPLVSSNPASLDPSPQGRADSLTWLPTFDAPRGCDLTPMHFYGLPDVVNPPVVYSDLKDFQQAQNPNHLIGNFLRNRHIIKFKMIFLLGIAVSVGFPPAGLSEADTNQVSSSATKSPLTTQQKYARSSQIHSPTQTQVRLGASRRLPEQDLIGSGNLTAKKSRTSVMSVEVLCEARQGFLPNPKLDCVKAVFWIVDDTVSDSESEATRRYEGAVFFDPQVMRDKGLAACMMKYRACGLPQLADIQVAFSEMNLFERFVAVMNEVDPDFVVGYEVHRESVGYLVRRGKVINIDMLQLLSKMPKEPPSFRNNQSGGSFEGEIKEDDAVVSVDQPTLFITGRVLLDLWNLMRSELKLTSYTYGNVAVHLLGETVPYFSPWQLSRWFQSLTSAHRAVRHMRKLTELNLLILKKTDLIRKTAECARLYGIDFTSVLTRGSQYRVEASLLKKAHALGYLLVSPSRRRVASQAPMEVIPLVMEPQSGFYEDPVVVLDFQSLYPSMIIAYNLCFSTCIGKLLPLEKKRTETTADGQEVEADTTGCLGVVGYPEEQSALSSLAHLPGSDWERLRMEDIEGRADAPYISPNGTVFCSKAVRQGILPMMCKEMLETRLMLKRAMKKHKGAGGSESVLQKVLDARQLAVKLLSN
eukprot:gene19941-20451_t